MSAPKDSTARLVVVRKAIEQLWPPSNDGHWAALEHALIGILGAKKKKPTGKEPGDYDNGGHWVEAGATCEVCAIPTEALLRVSRSQAPPRPADDNVIVLTRALVTRMRRKS